MTRTRAAGPLTATLFALTLSGCDLLFDYGEVACTADAHCAPGYFCSAAADAIGTCTQGERPTGTDADGDGVTIEAGDCDDTDPANFPGNEEACDGRDGDCIAGADFADANGDETDGDGDGSLACDDDCDDADPSNFGGNAEVCDRADNDCDGAVPIDEQDGDGDGFVPCADPDGLDADCDDEDESIHPGADEACDDVDTDCDGSFSDEFEDLDGDDVPDCIDDAVGTPDDFDGDGFDNDIDCEPEDPDIYPNADEDCDEIDSDCDGSLADGFSDLDEDGTPDCVDGDADDDGWPAAADCDDTDAANFPGNTESCDGQDNDCDTLLDAGADGVDGQESDDDGDGQWPCEGDCDDSEAAVLDGATEQCDGLDTDCDGSVPGDETDPDGDGSLECGGDCAPLDATVYAGAPESCDEVDSDCDGDLVDGAVDEDDDGIPDCVDPDVNVGDDDDAASVDADGDLFPAAVDCDDSDASIYPNAPESCDAIDQDCDGSLVDSFADLDGDGEPDCIDADVDGDGVVTADDCDDGEAAVFPGNTEVCPDGLDNDCDLSIDEDEDSDGDTFSTCVGGDCDDTDPAVNPAAMELCDGRDNNCDGDVDEGFVADLDGDGYSACANDCDDTDPTVYWGHPELCDGIDNDCNGVSDADTAGEVDGDGDGSLSCADCDDADPSAAPGLLEGGAPGTCRDGADNDCDGPVDDFDSDCSFCFGTSSVQGMDFVHTCAGPFEMGCTTGQSTCFADESPPHEVSLTRDFLLGRTEVTQGQWSDLMNNNPSLFSACGLDCPVEQVNWWDALAFANAVSTQEGLAECYSLSGCTGAAGSGLACASVAVISPTGDVYGCDGYRLPTEAEWEYAARGGLDLPFPGSAVVDEVAWHTDNAASTTHPVATKLPNPYGLSDLSGNVSEWVQDWYGPAYYSSSLPEDPPGEGTGTSRGIRGGSWQSLSIFVRVSGRDDGSDTTSAASLGIRLARSQ